MKKRSQKFVLVFASLPEAKSFLKVFLDRSDVVWSFSHYYAYAIFDRPFHFTVIVTGMGYERAHKGLSIAMERFTDVYQVVALGFASGLIKSAHRGDLCIAGDIGFISRETTENKRALSLALPPYFAAASEKPENSVKVWSRMLSSPSRFCSQAEKAAIFSLSGYPCFDSESYGWAEVCKKRDLPLLVLKVLIDGGGDDLNAQWMALLNPYGQLSWKSLFQNGVKSLSFLSQLKKVKGPVLQELLQPSATLLRNYLEDETLREDQQRHQQTVVSEGPQLSLLDPSQQ